MANVFNVAEYILKKIGVISTMKLQKLTYYCQAWSLAWDDVPLFNEDFQAWAHGPVCPELFQKHKGVFTVSEEDFREYADFNFSDEQIETMDAVITDLGNKSSQWLSDLTHSEEPWKNARKGYSPGEPCTVIITKESMQQYYGGISVE